MPTTENRVLDGQIIRVYNDSNAYNGTIGMEGTAMKVTGSGSHVMIASGHNLYFGGDNATFGGIGGTLLNIGVGGDYINLDVDNVTYRYKILTGSPNITVNGDVFFNNKVGIGTTSPVEALHVIGNMALGTSLGKDMGMRFLTSAVGSESASRIHFRESSGDTYGFSIGFNGISDNSMLNWKANTFHISRHDNNATGTIVMSIGRASDDVTFAGNIITSAGSIKTAGVGGTESGWMHSINVSGTVYSGGMVMSDKDWVRTYNNTGIWIRRNTTDVQTTALVLQSHFAGDMNTGLETSIDFINTDTDTTLISTPRARISVKQGTEGVDKESGGDFLIFTANGTALNTATLSERMRITDKGNVGINTATPTKKLDVNGTMAVRGGGTDIGGTTVNNAHLLIGADTGVRLGIDSNEIFVDGSNFDIGVNSASYSIQFKIANALRASIGNTGLTLGSGATVNAFTTDGTLGNTGTGSDTNIPTEKAVKNYVLNDGMKAILTYANLTLPAVNLVGIGSNQIAAGNHVHDNFNEVKVGNMFKFVSNATRKSLDLVYLG